VTTYNGTGTGNNTYNGTGTNNTLSYSGDPHGVTVTLATDMVAKDALGGPAGPPFPPGSVVTWEDSFSDIQNFVGGGGGNTAFQSIATGFYTFTGKGTNNTVDYSADADGVTINLATGTVVKDFYLSGFLRVNWQDTFSDIQNFVGAGSGNTAFQSIGTGGYTFNGQSANNTLDYSADADPVIINLVTDTVLKDILFSGNPLKGIPAFRWQDSFTDIQDFIGGGLGSATFQSIGTGFYTFTGKGANNTLDYSADTYAVTIILASDTVLKNVLFFGDPLKGIPKSYWQDSFTDIQNFVGNSSANDTIVFDGASTQYTIVANADGSVTVTDTVAGRNGTVHLDQIGFLQFTDKTAQEMSSGPQPPSPTPPKVALISAAADNNTHYVNAGHLVTITMTTSEATTVTGAPTVQLNDNEVAAFTGGSGTNMLTFTYVVQPGDNVADLQMTGLNLPSGAAILDQAGYGLSGTVTADLAIQVDSTTVPPTTVQQEVLGLYAALYNRAADFPGYSFWVGMDGQQSDSGGVTVANASTTAVTLNDAQVLGQGFVNTQATFFNQTYASLSDTQFINALYVNIGGNAGDPGGVAYWQGLLAQAEGSNPTAAQIQAARAGLVGQFVHDLIDFDLTPGAVALGLTAAQYQDAQTRQATINDKIAVSLGYSNISQQPGGNILDAHSVGDAAYNAAVAIIQGVTSDPSTVTVAIAGINNAVAHQDLTLI
jgi:hypothetical protein